VQETVVQDLVFTAAQKLLNTVAIYGVRTAIRFSIAHYTSALCPLEFYNR